MCGIFAFLSNGDVNVYTDEFLKILRENSNLINYRGPDNTKELIINNSIYMIFHRLSINDLSYNGDQPMVLNNCYLICNGEIFNHVHLKHCYNFHTFSNSDCEIILHLYSYLKNSNSADIIDELCNIIDGEFSFILFDADINTTYVARDPYGVRPLFIGYTENEDVVFSSELKGLNKICYKTEQFKPGSYMTIYDDLSTLASNYHSLILYNIPDKYNSILENINYYFRLAVYKRMMSEKEVCSLLSGGLDSSLVASILSDKLGPYKLKTFSIGLKNSPDLQNALLVSSHIKSIHYNVELTEQDFLDAIPVVIYNIESYDTTTVRASVGNYLISKYIKENTDCKVVFNGDYADEVCGGYKYMKKAPTDNEFSNECIRLVNDIHYFDCLRSDRSISSNGLEGRVPFADKFFVNYYLSIPVKYRTSKNCLEKLLLRNAFANDNLLPDEVLFRPKEAFSDGVTTENRSWHKIIKEFIDSKITDEYFEKNKSKYTHNTPVLKESLYYREIFETYFNKHSNVIPYLWMPKWCDNINDPSARELL
jgi:asparagine synthase (glutamine-hydrolysing)